VILSRRDLVRATTVVAAVAATTAVSGCSPPAEPTVIIPQNFFGLIASRKLELAEKQASDKIKLVLSTRKNLEVFAGPKDVIGKLSAIFHSAGWSMIGDNVKYAPGGYWSGFGGWHQSDLVSRNTVEFEMSGCGEDRLKDPVLNVFVLDTAPQIEQIFLMESYSLNYNRDPSVPPITKDASNG
jgi:hypothetical protein